LARPDSWPLAFPAPANDTSRIAPASGAVLALAVERAVDPALAILELAARSHLVLERAIAVVPPGMGRGGGRDELERALSVGVEVVPDPAARVMVAEMVNQNRAEFVEAA